MRKYLQLSLVILSPYLVISTLVCVFKGFLIDTVFQNNGLLILLTLIILYVIAFINSVVVFIRSLVKRWDAQEFSRINMVIKLIHVPAYVLIFLIGMICALTIFTYALAIILVIFDCMTIFFTGLIGLGSVIRSVSENKLPKQSAVIYSLLQFVFCADVISAIILYRTVKKGHSKLDLPIKIRAAEN